MASLIVLLPAMALAVGCHKEQVQVYRVSDSQDQTPSPAEVTQVSNSPEPGLPPGHPAISPPSGASQMPQGVVASDVPNAAPIKWTTPEGWTEVPPSEMRVASFKISGADGKQADVSVVPLPGMAGGDFANVNRWRGQVGLQPAADDELQNAAQNVEVGDQPAQLYDIAGQNPASGETNRILGVIQHRDGTAWFFKMTGAGDLVEQQKSAFIDFLKSVSFGSSQQEMVIHEINGQDQQSLPPGHPSIDMNDTAPAGPVSTDGQPGWTVPTGWQAVPAGQFLVAKFMIKGDNGATAAVNVSSSAGNGGGLPANVNRWRGQLGLAPENDIATTDFSVNGGQAQMVDMSGTNAQSGQPAELIGIMVTGGDRAWFYKLMGDPKVVAAQKDAFTQFVQGVKY